jgi:hydroxymethylbilane synthase
MATDFLQQALPQLNQNGIQINTIPIRGNVDTRLKKLNESGHYSGIILAVAGLNRLLNYGPAQENVKQLLKGKKLMFLPLFECPPAAGQGAIVAETNLNNQEAIDLLEKISNSQLNQAILEERKYANKYGFGCSRPFGVFHYNGANTQFTFATGISQEEKPFTEWDFKQPAIPENAVIFSGSDFMRSFYTETFVDHAKIDSDSKALFIASHKALHSDSLVKQAQKKRVWCAGARTWNALAKKGIWVEGSADGLGLEAIQPLINSPLVNLSKQQFSILTNNNSVVGWLSEGWKAVATYTLHPKLELVLVEKIIAADFIFWASFQQYQAASQIVKKDVIHACPSGKTAKLLLEQGIKPVIFPTIKAFQAWRTTIS